MKAVATWTLLALAVGAATADPMRPLAALVAASSPAPNVPRDAPAAPRAAPVLPPLVAIRESATGERRALLGEQWLAAGERYGSVKLLAVHTTSVEFADLARPAGQQRQTMHLLPPLMPTTSSAAPTTRRLP